MRRLLVALLWLAALAGAGWLLVIAGGPGGFALSKGSWLLAFGAVAADAVVYATVGAVLALRRPGNLVGSLLLLDGLLVSATFLGFLLGANRTAQLGPADPVAGIASLLGSMLIYPAIILAGPALAVFFPDGRLPSRRWRWPVAAVIATYVACVPLFLGQPGPLGSSLGNNPLGGLWPSVGADVANAAMGIVALTLPASLVMGVIALGVRFRRSRGIERAQLKWFVAANILFAVFMFASFADGASEPTVFDILALLSLSLPPVSIGRAIMRYRLYEIDRLISRTISWGLVSALLVGVFAGVVVALQGLLAGVTQGQTLAVAASTLIASALFQPIRRRVQRAVDRRFDRARVDAEQTAAAFSQRLRNEVDLGTLRSGLIGVAGEALRPLGVSIWLRTSAADEVASR